LCLTFLFSAACLIAAAAEPLDLRDGDRVVFLGNSFFERALDHGYLETELTLRYYDKAIQFRNLGWDGDTVYGHARTGGRRRTVFGDTEEGFQRLVDHVRTLQPTVVFVAYGFNECFDGEPGLKPFRKGLVRLLTSIASDKKTRFVLIIPPAPEQDVGLVYAMLKRYGAVIQNVASKHGHAVVDLFKESGALRKEHFENGIHLSRSGYQQVAKTTGDQLQLPEATSRISADKRERLRQTIVAKNRLYYHRWRPRNDAFVYGERKDEQKIAQTEPEKFEPFIAKQETLIRQLLKP
jgi:lysophospholipase L1-like esterase